MRIAYVAKHGSGGNDDEGAVAYALEQLGCSVHLVDEQRARLPLPGCDLVLFHKWFRPDLLKRIAAPKVFWYFDLVKSPEPEEAARSAYRERWMAAVLPCCTVGFCTDGSWAASDSRLYHLPQGCDERQAVLLGDCADGPSVLFAGSEGCGERRSLLGELRSRYPGFERVQGAHGRRLAELLSRSAVAVAPPYSSGYWSNRVYVTLSLGGCLVHPDCEGLGYAADELATYRTRAELFQLVDELLADRPRRAALRARGFMRTLADCTYRARCRELLAEVERRK